MAVFTGGSGIDVWFGTAEDDFISGFSGNDTLQGGQGADTIDGGQDTDTLSYYEFEPPPSSLPGASRLGVKVDLFIGVATDNWGYSDTVFNFENVVGSDQADLIIGNTLDNVFTGNLGNDTLRGGLGMDTLDGGGGIDTADYSDQSAGVSVTLNGINPMGVRILGAVEDIINNIENVIGGSGNDFLVGDGFNNVFRGGGGIDALNGGGGSDTADYSDKTAPVFLALMGGTASTVRVGGVGEDRVVNIENVIGGSANDSLQGDAQANSLIGGSGADTLTGGAGRDTLDGGSGSDTTSFADRPAGVVVTLSGAVPAPVYVGGVLEDLLINIENVVGSAGNDTLIGDGLDNVFSGGAGIDAINGGGGTDTADYSDKAVAVAVTLNGATAATVVVGGAGEDRIAAIENLIGGSAGDTFIGDGMNNTFRGGAGIDAMNGGAGNDTADYSDKTAAVVVALNGSTAVTVFVGGVGEDRIAAFENIVGGSAGDSLTGDALVNWLSGGAGRDTLNGGAGSDTASFADRPAGVVVTLSGAVPAPVYVGGVLEDLLINIENVVGSAGNDTLIGDGLNNVFSGGAGIDAINGGGGTDTADYSDKTVAVAVTLNGATAATVVVGGVGEDRIAAIENLIGGSAGDTFIGDALANSFRGGAGIDAMNGGAGTDTADYSDKTAAVVTALNGAAAVTVFVGGLGEDRIAAFENLIGGSAGDSLTGDALANWLSGGAGNDTLNGGLGNDTLVGGAGNDHYVFGAAPGASNIDTISDFQSVLDKIVLDDDVFTALGIVGTATGAALTASKFQLGGAANDTGDRIIYNQTTGQLFYDTDGSGAVAQQQIALIGVSTHAALSAGDFLVVA